MTPVRVVVMSQREGSAVLRAMGVSPPAMTPRSITIVPIAGETGLDVMPTVWMTLHSALDSTELPELQPLTGQRIERIKGAIRSIPRRSKELRDRSPSARRPLHATDHFKMMSFTLNTLFGENSRALEQQARDMVKRGAAKSMYDAYRSIEAPAVKERISGKPVRLADPTSASSQRFVDRRTASSYMAGGPGDVAADILSAEVFLGGYRPDLTLLNPAIPEEKAVIDVAQEVSRDMLQGAGDDLVDDLKGKVTFIFPS